MSDEAENRVNETQDAAVAAAEEAKEAAEDANAAVAEAKDAVKDYWAARDAQIAAGYRAAEARRRR